MKLPDKISWLMGRVQRSLFPHMNQCLPTPLTEQEKRLVSILEIVQVERYVPRNTRRYRHPGRKPLDRQACARAFVAKALYRHPTTSDLRRALQSAENLRRICGFKTAGDIPSESTLSRAFAEFAAGSLGGRVHDALVKEYLAEELVGHISRDSTAIVGREKPAKKKKEPKKPRKRGRPAKGEQREPAVEKRLDRQVRQSVEEAIRELPVICDRGTKKNAKGYKESWNGYKLHLDTNDIGLPISALVTAASLHDSQAAIPLIKLTSGKVTYLYDLMDAAYDAKRITETSWKFGNVPISALVTAASLHDSQAAIPLIKLTSGKVTYLYDLMDAAYDAKRITETSWKFGNVPITDKNSRGQEVAPMTPHEAERYKIRSGVERANSRLKEDFGANNVMVKGHSKVTLYLMFGVITLFADQLLRLIG